MTTDKPGERLVLGHEFDAGPAGSRLCTYYVGNALLTDGGGYCHQPHAAHYAPAERPASGLAREKALEMIARYGFRRPSW